MENLNSVWQIVLIALVAGTLIGVLAHRLFAPSIREAEKLRVELDEARRELTRFRVDVNRHFDKTSNLVNDLTQNYVHLYRHLADGAETLANGKSFDNLLEQVPERLSIPLDDRARAAQGETTSADMAAGSAAAEAPADDIADRPQVSEAGTATESTAEPGPQAETESAGDTAAAAEAETETEDTAATPAAKLNVDALDQAIEKADDTAAASGSGAESSDRAGTSRTTH